MAAAAAREHDEPHNVLCVSPKWYADDDSALLHIQREHTITKDQAPRAVAASAPDSFVDEDAAVDAEAQDSQSMSAAGRQQEQKGRASAVSIPDRVAQIVARLREFKAMGKGAHKRLKAQLNKDFTPEEIDVMHAQRELDLRRQDGCTLHFSEQRDDAALQCAVRLFDNDLVHLSPLTQWSCCDVLAHCLQRTGFASLSTPFLFHLIDKRFDDVDTWSRLGDVFQADQPSLSLLCVCTALNFNLYDTFLWEHFSRCLHHLAVVGSSQQKPESESTDSKTILTLYAFVRSQAQVVSAAWLAHQHVLNGIAIHQSSFFTKAPLQSMETPTRQRLDALSSQLSTVLGSAVLEHDQNAAREAAMACLDLHAPPDLDAADADEKGTHTATYSEDKSRDRALDGLGSLQTSWIRRRVQSLAKKQSMFGERDLRDMCDLFDLRAFMQYHIADRRKTWETADTVDDDDALQL